MATRIIDLGLTNDGDLMLDVNPDINETDLQLAEDEDNLRQQVIIRLKTYRGDWLSFMGVGANMVDYIGLPNTKEVADRIAANIVSAITYDKFIDPSLVNIYSIPVNENEILFTIRIEYKHQAITLPISYSIKEGVAFK
jgi:hypothetical protein